MVPQVSLILFEFKYLFTAPKNKKTIDLIKNIQDSLMQKGLREAKLVKLFW